MSKVTAEVLQKLKEFIESLPVEISSKCVLCNETLTHIVKQAEVDTGAGTATVTRALSDHINESAAPGDMVSGDALRERVRRNEGLILTNRENKPDAFDLGVGKSIISAAKEIRFEERVNRKAERDALLVERPLPLENKYQVIYADPPWAYNDKCEEGSVQSGGAIKHYPTMTIPEICALPINSLSDTNAVLFIWVTSPLLEDVFKVITAWGFKYKASFVWDKVKHNMGHYNSVRHEFLLIATKGSCTPDNLKLLDSVQSIERTEHSKKPDEFYEIIETLYAGKKIELFARNSRENWSSWGNEF